MASENKNENVMLTGQTAYFKKNGSMTNYGKVTVADQEHTTTYGPGFIDEESTIQPAILETSDDYKQTLADMKLYLAGDFIEEAEDYLVKANAENIVNQLSTRATKLNTIVNHISKYNPLPYLMVKNEEDFLDMSIPFHLENDFVLEIKALFDYRDEAYDIISGGDKLTLSQSANHEFYLNGVHLDYSLTNEDHNSLEYRTPNTLIISQLNGELYVEIAGERVDAEIPGFSGECDIVLNTGFAKRIDEIKIYSATGETDAIYPRWNTEERAAGLHDLLNDLWYTPTVDIKLHGDLYSYCQMYNGAIDLGYHPGPNTGIEIKYAQYYSQSSSTNTFRGIIGCVSGYSVANTVSFGMILGSGSKIYATRNNNAASWVDSGVANTVTGTSNWDIITINKNNDGLFKCTGAHNFSKTLSGTLTQTAIGGNTLWLNGYNDLGRYIPLERMPSRTFIRGGQNGIYVGYIKIYEGDKLVRYYVPGYDLGNSQRGMYDVVEQKIYPYNSNYCYFYCYGGTIPEPEIN